MPGRQIQWAHRRGYVEHGCVYGEAVLGAAEGGLGLGEHDVRVPGGAVAGPGQCGQGQAVVAQEVCNGGASSEIKQSLRCSAVLKSRIECKE